MLALFFYFVCFTQGSSLPSNCHKTVTGLKELLFNLSLS